LRSHPEVAQRFYADVLQEHGIHSDGRAHTYA
jgi:hypothetical protein